MGEPAIRIEGLGKCYRLGGQPFWALRDVDLVVERGEILGVVGRNGAGKTTLLRLLSRITAPTEGRAEIRGRVGTLLETGTGFHQDLTGRENVYLNGAILGMSRTEIDARLEEIVEFSGVGRFIDQRIRTYSSGMASRLAFSVAAHLDTEVLLVDEVLAVGDLGFREKCLAKMEDVTAQRERTVVFVSHSMGAVQSLCTRAMLLEAGRIHRSGTPAAVIQVYRELMLGEDGRSDLRRTEGRRGTGLLRLVAFEVQDPDGNPIDETPAGAPVRLVLEYESELENPPKDVVVTVVVVGSKGTRLFGLPSDVLRADLSGLQRRGRFVCTLPRLPLLPGHYDLVASCLVDRQLVDKIDNLCSIAVAESDPFGTGRLQPASYGDGLVDFEWAHEKGEDA